MTEADMIEAMARAIYERVNGYGCRPWRQIDHKPAYRDQATASRCATRCRTRLLNASAPSPLWRTPVDKLTDHELQILREINGDLPASSWGAWVGACYESLSGGGYITREGITEKGKQYLATASLASASAGNGELEPRCRDDKLLPALKECILTLGAAGEFHDTGVIALALERIQFDAARIRTLSAQLAEAEKYNGWHQEALLVRDAALERAEKAEGERDNARAECSWLAKLLIRLREALNNIAEGAEDEGDRVYFGSTNDADWLKEIACEVDSYAFDRIMRESKWLDYIESSAKANARAAAAEAEVERLRAALRPFAKAASDYERQGEFFSNNIELVLRVSVFAAPEYHNSTAVQVGDLRRARSELEAGHE